MPMKLLILDRDGVINQESPEFIKSPEEWRPIKGSLEAIGRLSQAGYHVVVITNQSGVGRGLFSADMLCKIHARMIDYVQQHGGSIQSILFCPHHPDDDCECRKPKTGLYDDLANRLNLTFNDVFSVGDSVRDLVAAKAAGARPVLVKTGNGRKSLKELKTNSDIDTSSNSASDSNSSLDLDGTLVFDNLAAFVSALLKEEI